MASTSITRAAAQGQKVTMESLLTGQTQRRTELDEAISSCRSAFTTVAVFSFFINVLLLTPSIYMMQVYDRVLSSGSMETLAMMAVLGAAALFVLGLLDSLRAAMTLRIGRWLSDRLGPVYLAGSVRTRLHGDTAGAQPLRDLSQIQSFIGSPGLSVFFDSPWVPAFVALIWIVHPWLGILAIVSLSLFLLLTLATELLTRDHHLKANISQIAANQQAEAAIRNAEVVRVMGMLPAITERWQDLNATALDAAQQAAERSAALGGITKFVRLLVQMGVIGLGALLCLRGELTGGAMMACSILLSRALGPIEQGMGAWRNFSVARIAYGRLKARLRSLPAEPDRIRLPNPAAQIKAENVSYTPPGAKRPVLQNVSFSIQPGQAVAVIGPSASGKSTLCRLILGIARPNAGQIRLAGSEIAHWDQEQLGRFIGYLPQDVELFAGSVRENIARMAQAEDEAVVAAARLAHAHEMIQQLPDGYDTQIGDGGARLSAGQRQRLGLARAVFGSPKLIVLDEPNSNLDQIGESALAATVNEMKEQGAAVIIVGHRPSTLAQADYILVLVEGRVKSFGPRNDVLQQMRKTATAKADQSATPMPEPASAAGDNPPVASKEHNT